MTPSETPDTLVLPEDWHLHYDYIAGPVTTRFLRGLQEGRIEGTRSPSADMVYVPPRAYCERTFEPIDEWVEVGPEGTVDGFTIVAQKFEGYRDPPFVVAFVRLDGADTAMCNFLEMEIDSVEEAAARLAPGARARVVFKEPGERQARITDFSYQLIS